MAEGNSLPLLGDLEVGLGPRHFQLGLENLELRDVARFKARLCGVAQPSGQLQRLRALAGQASRKRRGIKGLTNPSAHLAGNRCDFHIGQLDLLPGKVDAPLALAPEFQGLLEKQALMRQIAARGKGSGGVGQLSCDPHTSLRD